MMCNRYLSLIDAIRMKLLFNPFSSQKDKTYDLFILHEFFNVRLRIYILYRIHIFRAFLFKNHCTFSLKKYLLKHLKVLKSIKRDLLQGPTINHLSLPGTTHQPS